MSLSDFGLLPQITANNSLTCPSASHTHHYLHPLAHTLFCNKFRFESANLAGPASRSKQSHLPTRAQLVAWFGSLSKEEITQATSIDNTQFIENFIKKYPKQADSLVHLPSCRSYKLPFPNETEGDQQILGKVRVAMMADPLIYLEISQMTGQQVLQWMDSVSRVKIFDLPHRSLNRENPQQNLLWFNSATFHPLTHWLASELQKSILRYYFNPKDRLVRLKTLSKYVNDKKSTKEFAAMLQFTLQDIRGGVLEEKAKLIESFRHLEESIREQLEQNILNLVEEKKRKKKKRTRKDKPVKAVQQDLADGNLLMDENSQQTQPLLGSKLQIIETATDLQQYSANQKESSNEEVLQCPIINDDNTQYSQPVQSDLQSFRNLQNVICESKSTNCTSASKNEDCEVSHDDPASLTLINSPSHLNDSFQSVRLNRKSSHQLISNYNDDTTQDKQLADNFATNEGGEMKTRRKRKRKTNKNQNKVVDEFKEKIVASILNKQFTAMVDSLSTQSNNSFESKAIAFERVRYFVKSLYSMSEAVLFGSNAVGLALPTSDIDIMLVQMCCRNKEEICDALAQIAIYINTMGWVTSCSTYFNAKVPVLKLEIDPSITYFTPKRKSDYFGVSNPYLAYYLDVKDTQKATPIKVDITISTEDGKVSDSTELMRYWLDQKPSMQRVLLALKYSLSVRGYSQNFKGGIGSYCLFVMVAAYFLHFKQSREQADCDILLDILRFYGQDFQNQLKIVSLIYQGACFIDNEQGQQKYEISDQILFNNLLKIIDPLNNKLMSSSCLQYNNIKAEWRHIRSQILKIEELVQNQIYLCFHNTADISKLMSNRKALQRWINKLQSRIDFSIAKIMAGQR